MALTKLCFELLPDMIEPYIWFNQAVIKVQVLPQPTDGFVSVKEKVGFCKSKQPLAGPGGVDGRASDCSPEVDESIRFICY